MNREALARYIMETYSAKPDHPWAKYPNYEVFRHTSNRKWFAAVLDITWKNLGLSRDGGLDVLNVKCSPLLIGSFRQQPGIFPGYHMSKASWLSIALDGSADGETIKTLLEMSFNLTAPKRRKPRGGETP